MRKLTKLDLQALAETMPVIPVDEQRFYLAMGSYGPEPSGTYLSQEDIDNFLSGLDRKDAYNNDCVFATVALANNGGTNDQAEINQLAEDWAKENRKDELQKYIDRGMTSDEAAQKYLKKSKGAALSTSEANKVYDKHLKNCGTTVIMKYVSENNYCHWAVVSSYDSQTGTFTLFDGSESANSGWGRTPTINIQEMIDKKEDFIIWTGGKRWGAYAGTMGSWDEDGVFTPYGNDSGSGSSSSDENGSSDCGSSGSSGDDPCCSGHSSGY